MYFIVSIGSFIVLLSKTILIAYLYYLFFSTEKNTRKTGNKNENLHYKCFFEICIYTRIFYVFYFHFVINKQIITNLN